MINFVHFDIICQDFYMASNLFHSIFNRKLLISCIHAIGLTNKL